MLLQGKHMEPSSDLASVLRTCLLPQLCLKHLQSLALTCRALKCLVLAASVPTWTLAAARQSLPTVCISAADPYSSITEVAAQQMAIAAGQGSEAARMHGGSAALQLREPMLLHPAFAEVAHCSPHSSRSCIKSLESSAGRTKDERFKKLYAYFPHHQTEDGAPEQCCAPDGQVYLAVLS